MLVDKCTDSMLLSLYSKIGSLQFGISVK